MEKISRVEDLNNYIRVIKTPLWILIIAGILIIVVTIFWLFNAELDGTTLIRFLIN